MGTLKISSDAKPHILLIDDEKEITNVYKDYLENSDFEVCITNSAQEAWQYLDKNKFDLIVTDIHMPPLNGDEFIKIVRKNIDHKFIPIIIASGCLNAIHESQAQRDENLFVIKKPIGRKDFLKIIKDALD